MQAKDGKSNNIQTALLGMAVLALAATVGTVGLLRQVGELGPKVGDIVTFDPLRQSYGDMTAQIAAVPTNAGPDATCMLDLGAMHAAGGSIVIEAREVRSSK